MAKRKPHSLERAAASYIEGGAIEKSYGRFQKLWTAYRFAILSEQFTGQRAIEMGIADGTMTLMLAKRFTSVTSVEGSKTLVDRMRRLIKRRNVRIEHSFFETYTPTQPVDTVIMSHVLEHVDQPLALLKRVARWIKPDGRILIMVPNADSLHRQVGVAMGVIPSVTSLDKGDRMVGHRRVFTLPRLRTLVRDAGLVIRREQGFFLKSFSNAQIERIATDRAIRALFTVGRRYPEVAAEILLVVGH